MDKRQQTLPRDQRATSGHRLEGDERENRSISEDTRTQSALHSDPHDEIYRCNDGWNNKQNEENTDMFSLICDASRKKTSFRIPNIGKV